MKKNNSLGNNLTEKVPNKHFLLIMRTTLIILFAFIFCSMAETGHSQNARVTINKRNVTLKEVLNEIESQTDYLFIYNEKVNTNEKVSVKSKQQAVANVLNTLLKDKDVDYSMEGNHIILSAIEKASSPEKGTASTVVQQQKKTITGTVVDVAGVPVIGANIIEAGTTNGTVTDIDGKFSLQVENNATIRISYIGYLEQDISTIGRPNFNITLIEDTKALDEVIVVGYGTQKKVNLTGAVASISSKELENRPVVNVEQALQGISPGLNISTSQKYGGEVGSPMDMNIRGVGSLTAGSGSPYILVDGVPMDLALVNPSDIENISVLKDAASAAIYGARAAYGVILVTTKRGKKNEKFSISYDTNIGWKTPTTLPQTANSVDYATAVNQSCLNSGIVPMYSDEVMKLMRQYLANPGSLPGIIAEPNDPTRWGQYDQTYANTDWYDVYFKDWALQQKHDISMIGSTDKSSLYVSLGYVDTNGQLNFFNEKYQRYNVTVNNDMRLTDWLTIRLNTKFVQGKKKLPIGYSGYDRTVNYHMFSRAYPTLPVYDPNGNFTESCSVAQILKEGGSEKSTNTAIWITPSFEITLKNNWKINGDFTYNYEGNKRLTHFAKVYVGEVDGKGKYLHHANNFNSVEEEQYSVSYTTGNLYTSYSKQLGRNDFNVLVGGQFEHNSLDKLTGKKRDLITDKVPSISTSTGVTTLSDEMSEWATLGAFVRLNYAYDEKYLIEFNGRYDGSSRFRRGKRWGFFPSVSVGYNISKERFWEDIREYVNTFKLRASYGTLGNQEVPNYLHIETLPVKTNLGYPIGGVLPVYTQTPDLISRNLTWEESRTTNVGTDLAFLGNRLNATFDWYNRKTINMFGPSEALPAVLGKNPPKKNNASLSTKGFELSITWRDKVSDDFSYSVTGLLSDNQSKVTEYNNPTKTISSYYVGQKIGEIWGYETADLFKDENDIKNSPDQSAIYAKWSPGDIKYKDLNNDGKINWGDGSVNNPGDKKIIGNKTPRFQYGLSLSGVYKDFDFSMFWQGVAKRDVFIGATTYFGFQSSKFFTNVYKHNLDYWREDNPNAFFAKPYATGEVNKNQQVQSRYLQNAAYLRLKNIQIGYTVPQSLLRKISIEKLRFYVSGDNLLTFTKLVSGIDPETTEGNWGNAKSYPVSLVGSFGLSLTF